MSNRSVTNLGTPASCRCTWLSLELNLCLSNYLCYRPNVLEVSRFGNTPTNPATRRRTSISVRHSRTIDRFRATSSIRNVNRLGDTPLTNLVNTSRRKKPTAHGTRKAISLPIAQMANYEIWRPIRYIWNWGNTLFEQERRTRDSANHLHRSSDQQTIAPSESSIEAPNSRYRLFGAAPPVLRLPMRVFKFLRGSPTRLQEFTAGLPLTTFVMPRSKGSWNLPLPRDAGERFLRRSDAIYTGGSVRRNHASNGDVTSRRTAGNTSNGKLH